jgi:membrane dipeptidase
MKTLSDEAKWARDFVEKSLGWDAHAGIFPAPDADLSGLPEWTAAGVNYVSINVAFDVVPWEACAKPIYGYHKQLEGMSSQVIIAKSVADIEAAKKAGKLAVSFDIEGTNALNGDIGMVSTYHDLGVRQMLFAYNLNNEAAGGCHDNDQGLTNFGKDVVREMNRVGMLVDCSHVGRRSSLEMMEYAQQPVVFTHSNPAALCQHQRNISDEQIRKCAETGGVIGVNGMGIFLGDNDVSPETFANHICYIADLVGPAHVGFGLDFKPKQKSAPNLGAILRSRPDYWPKGQKYGTVGMKLFSPANMAEVVVILYQRGWSSSELAGFLGGNFMRVANQVWR